MKLTAEQREMYDRFKEMERRFARRVPKVEPVPAAPPRHDPTRIDIGPGEVRMIDGTMWGVCGDCERLIRFGRFGGLHACRR